MAALPLTRHIFHGDGNYALHPQPCTAIPASRAPQPPAPEWEWDQTLLSDSALTGMTRQQLNDLTETLSSDGYVKRGRPPRLDFPEQVVAAVLHLRVALAAEPLAALFGSSRTAMHRTLLKIRRLLKAHDIVISPAATPPTALAVLQARVRAQSSDLDSKIKTTC